jgi:hypothetical protein
MYFKQKAAGVRTERPVHCAGRPAGIGEGCKPLAALAVRIGANCEIPAHEKHLFPVLVHERLRRVGTGDETQESRPTAALVPLVERAGEDLLLDAGRITPCGQKLKL